MKTCYIALQDYYHEISEDSTLEVGSFTIRGGTQEPMFGKCSLLSYRHTSGEFFRFVYFEDDNGKVPLSIRETENASNAYEVGLIPSIDHLVIDGHMEY